LAEQAEKHATPPIGTRRRAGRGASASGLWHRPQLLNVMADLLKAYGPYTHAARALALWRYKDPFQAWNEHRRSGVSLVPTSGNL
jgi:hypothetical protein